MNSFAKLTEAPLAGDGGISAPVFVMEDDPFGKLDDLMAVVEALCPVWPQREPFVDGGRMLL